MPVPRIGWILLGTSALLKLVLSTAARSRLRARVSNPGCYSSAAIALLAPLTAAGLIAGDAPISINAVSGYSGGGRR